MSRFRLLILDKSEGITSFASLGEVKRFYKGSKVGHAGTLDKFASGLMIVLTGQATRLVPVFSSLDKSYQVTARFGEETDTLDPEGEVIRRTGLPTEDKVISVLPSFCGEIMQQPPVYSAIHVDGKRAYQEARKGREVEMPSRPVHIYSLEMDSFSGDEAVFTAHVSKGTYIRSLVRDIASAADSSAHAVSLRRLSIGPYALADVTGIDSSFETTMSLLSRLIVAKCTLKSDKVFSFRNGLFREECFTEKPAEGFFLVYDGSQPVAVCEKRGGRVSLVTFIDNID